MHFTQNTQLIRYYYLGDIRTGDGLIFNANADSFQTLDEFWNSEIFDGRRQTYFVRLLQDKKSGRGGESYDGKNYFRPKDAKNVIEG